MNKPSAAIDHLNLTVHNFAASAHWYREAFGFEIVEQGIESNGPWGVLRSGDSMLCIYEDPKREEPRSGDSNEHQIYHFGLRVADQTEWEATIRRLALKTYYSSPIRYPILTPGT